MRRSSQRSSIRLGLAISVSAVLLACGITAAQAAPPTAPGAVSGIGYVNAVRLSWVPPDDGGSPITQYAVQDNLGFTWPVVLSDDLTYPFVISRLPNGVTPLPNAVARRFRVRADNADGPGAWSAYSRAVTPHATYPGPVWSAAGSIPGDREGAGAILLKTGPRAGPGARRRRQPLRPGHLDDHAAGHSGPLRPGDRRVDVHRVPAGCPI